MKSDVKMEIKQAMLPYLDNGQMLVLGEVLDRVFACVEMRSSDGYIVSHAPEGSELLSRFVSAKSVEGCSPATLRYYRSTILRFLESCCKSVTLLSTEDLRQYLATYERKSGCSKVNMDNIRRILSSFFSWLEDEDYILKSPIRRIRKIRSKRTVKEAYTDEMVEMMRDECGSKRDLAIIDLLSSTGMRVGELVGLDISDVNFERRECVVGKGSKERVVYFDVRTKIHLLSYLESRSDNNPALFVSLLRPHARLEISGVEGRLRSSGVRLGIAKVHPHRFRRTLATRAIGKGMPVEQVQVLLGHSKIETTMQYAQVDQGNVRISHRRYIA